jgi:hypothetical protein
MCVAVKTAWSTWKRKYLTDFVKFLNTEFHKNPFSRFECAQSPTEKRKGGATSAGDPQVWNAHKMHGTESAGMFMAYTRRTI